VNVDALLVGTDRWRMASLAVEPDGSVMISVVPSATSAICSLPGHRWYRTPSHQPFLLYESPRTEVVRVSRNAQYGPLVGKVLGIAGDRSASSLLIAMPRLFETASKWSGHLSIAA